MAKFLTTKGISFFFDELFKTSQEFVYIVTPYFKLDKQLVERIHDSLEDGLNIVLIFGKNKRQLKTLDPMILDSLSIYYYEDLHAKFYMNEKHLLITSMNLHIYSEANNREAGVLFTKSNNEDTNVIEECLKEFNSILKQSEKINIENQDSYAYGRKRTGLNESPNDDTFDKPNTMNLIKKALRQDFQIETADITDKTDLIKDLKFSEGDIEDFWLSLEYHIGFYINCNSTVIGSIEKFINDYSWEDNQSKEKVSVVYSYAKNLNENYQSQEFQIGKWGMIYRNNFPNTKFNFDTQYGFASFHLKEKDFNLKTFKNKILAELKSINGEYRVYVNAYKISVYSKKDFKPLNIVEEVQYYIIGVTKLAEVIKKISSQIK